MKQELDDGVYYYCDHCGQKIIEDHDKYVSNDLDDLCEDCYNEQQKENE